MGSLDDEFKMFTSDHDASLVTYFNHYLSTDAMSKLFAFHVVDIGTWIERDQSPHFANTDNTEAKKMVLDLYPVRQRVILLVVQPFTFYFL